jgi:NAD(P)H-hydrate epimerase
MNPWRFFRLSSHSALCFMKCFTADELRDADRNAVEKGSSGLTLMGRASKALARELHFFSDEEPLCAVIVAGPGNNGGDGFGLATHLCHLGWQVWVWVAAPRDRIKGDALTYLEQAEALGVPVTWIAEAADWEQALLGVPPGAWMVDALLGTGATEAPRGAIAGAVSFLKRAAWEHRIWSVDLPTGLNPDSGTPFDEDCCVRADTTLTLGGPKRGMIHEEASTWFGSVSVLDIGLGDIAPPGDKDWQVLSDLEIRKSLPKGRHDHHKGDRGHTLFIGGSPGMSGAISMAAFGALRSGAGLSTILGPSSIRPRIETSKMEVMVLSGKEGDLRTLRAQNIEYAQYKAVCIGPGLRVNLDTDELVRRVVNECPVPLILDADALNCFKEIDLQLAELDRPVFLTPHPGEMGRLLDMETAEVQHDRAAAALKAAAQTGCHVVLKGARSRIVNPGHSCWINLTGNAALATAGTGDVLAGILTGLAARGVARDLALPLAVALHGRAGELASIRKGISSVVAGDVLEALPQVMRYAEGR